MSDQGLIDRSDCLLVVIDVQEKLMQNKSCGLLQEKITGIKRKEG